MEEQENAVVTNDKKTVGVFILNKDFIFSILGLIITWYPTVNAIFRIRYKRECEVFYGLPGRYFDEKLDSRMLYLGGMLILLLLCVVPVFTRKYAKEKKTITKGYWIEDIIISLVMGLLIGLFNVINWVQIMQQTSKINNVYQTINAWMIDRANIIICMVVVFSQISILGVNFMYEIKRMKNNWMSYVISTLIGISLSVSIVLMVYGTRVALDISLEDKTKYEFVTYDDNNEYVVLTSYEGELLVVPFEKNDDGKYIFKTGQYKFIEMGNGTFQYKDINNTPQIDRSVGMD